MSELNNEGAEKGFAVGTLIDQSEVAANAIYAAIPSTVNSLIELIEKAPQKALSVERVSGINALLRLMRAMYFWDRENDSDKNRLSFMALAYKGMDDLVAIGRNAIAAKESN